MNKQKVKGILLDVAAILLGTFIYSVGINVLIVPNQLTSGGLTGLATQLSYLFDIPVGGLVLVMNIPLLVLGWVKLGGKFVISTAFATVSSSLMIDLLEGFLPAYRGDQLLVALFGGAIMGLGVSLLYLRGTSMGGSDIVSTLINKRYAHFPIGKISLVMNALVIISSIFVYDNIEGALCSAVGAFVSSKVVDSVLVGADSGSTLFVVTNKPYELAQEIHNLAGRGSTVLAAHGTATGEEKHMLMCVARRYEFSKIIRAINNVDSKAFVVVSDAREVRGNGFKELA